jgi:hypothetical protein
MTAPKKTSKKSAPKKKSAKRSPAQKAATAKMLATRDAERAMKGAKTHHARHPAVVGRPPRRGPTGHFMPPPYRREAPLRDFEEGGFFRPPMPARSAGSASARPSSFTMRGGFFTVGLPEELKPIATAIVQDAQKAVRRRLTLKEMQKLAGDSITEMLRSGMLKWDEKYREWLIRSEETGAYVPLKKHVPIEILKHRRELIDQQINYLVEHGADPSIPSYEPKDTVTRRFYGAFPGHRLGE